MYACLKLLKIQLKLPKFSKCFGFHFKTCFYFRFIRLLLLKVTDIAILPIVIRTCNPAVK